MAEITVAIDGPAGAGKSTVAKMTAEALGLRYLDTGAMYRCVGLLCLRSSGDPTVEGDATEAAEQAEITFRDGKAHLNGEDVSGKIRTREVDRAAFQVSRHPGVRGVLAEQQKRMVAEGGWVLEGRDTTTVIAPDAEVKVFLTASIEERARRRRLALPEEERPSLAKMAREVVSRDYQDYTRSDSPLTPTEEARLFETINHSPEQIVEQIVAWARDRTEHGERGSV